MAVILIVIVKCSGRELRQMAAEKAYLGLTGSGYKIQWAILNSRAPCDRGNKTSGYFLLVRLLTFHRSIKPLLYSQQDYTNPTEILESEGGVSTLHSQFPHGLGPTDALFHVERTSFNTAYPHLLLHISLPPNIEYLLSVLHFLQPEQTIFPNLITLSWGNN